MTDEISVVDIIITWFLFWVLTLTGLALFAGVTLVPLWQEQTQLVMEYQTVSRQVEGIQNQVDQINEQREALWVDPAYTERIARNTLNLRKVGEETISIEPLSVVSDQNKPNEENISKIDLPKDFSQKWWYKPFLDQQRRTWFLYLACGLVAAGLVIAIASKDRRMRMGFRL
ncbi:MAG: hypothetical protein WC975_04035 [Phycisphaerae bacterium]